MTNWTIFPAQASDDGTNKFLLIGATANRQFWRLVK